MSGSLGVAKAIPPRTKDSSLSVGTFMKNQPSETLKPLASQNFVFSRISEA